MEKKNLQSHQLGLLVAPEGLLSIYADNDKDGNAIVKMEMLSSATLGKIDMKESENIQ